MVKAILNNKLPTAAQVGAATEAAVAQIETNVQSLDTKINEVENKTAAKSKAIDKVITPGEWHGEYTFNDLLPATSVTLTWNESFTNPCYYNETAGTFAEALIADTKYQVFLNGEEYVLSAHSNSLGTVVLGNEAVSNNTAEDNGYPFLITVSTTAFSIATKDIETIAELSVQKITEATAHPWIYEFLDANITADSNGVISLSNEATLEEREICRSAMMSSGPHSQGKLIVYSDSEEKPAANIPVTLILIG